MSIFNYFKGNESKLLDETESKDKKIKELEGQLAKLQLDNELAIKKLENEHKLELKDKEFELRHYKDNTIKNLQSEVNEKEKEIEVLKKENEMMKKITDLNADIIDIRKLVEKLIDKLPEINLQSLTVKNNSDE
ncbi:hypothetical protein KY314_00310 [Candidatus Woesearchaeota archaeon]|nr:hypothetical protein [Candidatus Woesearchaeota archaeon]